MKADNANYIVGFVDGEGSFNISFIKREDYKHNLKITPSFNISQKETEVLEWVKSKFNCGTIRSRGDGVFYYEVQDIKSLQNVIIPFFKKYKLKTRKSYTFNIFSEIVDLISKGEHLEREGILKIYNLREKIKVGRSRKYSRKEVINLISNVRESSETTRQTDV